MKTFKEISVGETFRFASETAFPYSGMKTGPWVKTSARGYKHLDDGMSCKVGTVNVEVISN